MRSTVLRIVVVAGVSLAVALVLSFAVSAQDDQQQAQPSGEDQTAPADQPRHAKPTKLAGMTVDPADVPNPEKDGKLFTSAKWDFQVLLPTEWRGIEVRLKDQKFFAQRAFGDDTVEFNVNVMDSFSTEHGFSDYVYDQRKEIENLSDDAVVMNNADLPSEEPTLKIHLIDYKYTHETLGRMICSRVFYFSSTTDRLYTVNFTSKESLFKDAGPDMVKILRTFKVGV
jgi:hypothetical protein